jgi:hypothetical protein
MLTAALALQLLDRRNHVALLGVRADCCRFLYRTPDTAGGGIAAGGTVAAPAAGEVGTQVCLRCPVPLSKLRID